MLTENVLKKTVLSVSCGCDHFIMCYHFYLFNVISNSMNVKSVIRKLYLYCNLYTRRNYRVELVQLTQLNIHSFVFLILSTYIPFKIIQSLSKTLSNVSANFPTVSVPWLVTQRLHPSNKIIARCRYISTEYFQLA